MPEVLRGYFDHAEDIRRQVMEYQRRYDERGGEINEDDN